MKGAQGVRPADVGVLPPRATATTMVTQEISIADAPEIYTSSTDEALLQSLVESNKPFAQQHSQVVRSRQNLSFSAASTLPTSAGSSAIAGSPVLLPAMSPSGAEVPSGGENQMRLTSRSQDALALVTSGGPPTISGEAAGGVGTTTPGIGGGTATGTPMARRKPVPSLVPPPVLVTVVRGEGEQVRDANGNLYPHSLPFPAPPSPLPSPNRAYLSPSDAEGSRRWSGSYSDDTLAVMEEQRRKRAVLHRRYHHDAAEDDTAPEPDPEEKEGGQIIGDASTRLKSGGGGIVPFPGKRDSMYYPPSTTQRQLLQATGASARRRREQVRDSTYSCGTKKTNGNSFKGWMSKLCRFKVFGVKIWWIVRA